MKIYIKSHRVRALITSQENNKPQDGKSWGLFIEDLLLEDHGHYQLVVADGVA